MALDFGGVVPVSQLVGYYDWIAGQCVGSSLGGSISAGATTVAIADPDWDLRRRLIALTTFFVLSISPLLLRLWVAVRKREFWRAGTVVRRPKFVKKSFLFRRINEPRFWNAYVIVSWAAFFFLLGDVFFRILAVTEDSTAAPSDLIAIAVAASAVLFPVLLIIIQREPEATVSGVSNPEILLHYARAIPSGLTILTFLALLSFSVHNYWARGVAALSVIIAAIVFFLLLRATFTPGTRRRARRQILRFKVDRAVSATASDRAGFKKTESDVRALNDPKVVHSLFSLDRDHVGTQNITIYSEKTGLVDELHLDKVKRASRLLAGVLESYEIQPTVGSDSVAARDERKATFKIAISTYVGAQVRSVEAKLYEIQLTGVGAKPLPEKMFDEVISLLKSAVVIDPFGLPEEEFVEFEEYGVRLRQAGRNALDKNDIAAIAELQEVFEAILEATLEKFREIGAVYSLTSARSEVPLFGDGWKPLDAMLENIQDLQDLGLPSAKLDDDLRSEILYLPSRLSKLAFEARELLSFVRLTRISVLQYDRLAEAGRLAEGPVRWLESLLDYSIGYELKRAVTDEGQKDRILEFVKSVYLTLQEHAVTAIDRSDLKHFESAVSALREYPDLFRHEEFKYKIQILESTIQRMSQGSRKDLEQAELDNLKKKQALKRKLYQWRLTVHMGLGTYALLFRDGKARGSGQHVEDAESQRQILQSIIEYVPTDLLRLLELYFEASHRNMESQWGWGLWEKMEPGVARCAEFDSYLNKFLALAFVRASAHPGKEIDVESLDVRWSDTYAFRAEKGGVRDQIPGAVELANAIGLNVDLKSVEEKLFPIFDRLVRHGNLQSELELVGKDISPARLADIRVSFEEQFMRVARLRKVFRVDRNPAGVAAPNLQWGANILEPREFYVDDPGTSFSDIGKHFGEGLGQGEDEFVFQELMAHGERTDTNQSVAAMIRTMVERGVPAARIAVLTARDPYMIKSLRSDPAFRPNYDGSEGEGRARIDGTYDFNGEGIPVFHVFLRGENAEEGMIVVDTSNVTIRLFYDPSVALRDSGFTFSLVDPKVDEGLRADLLKKNPDWLSKFPEELKPRLVAKYVWIRLIEKLQVEIAESRRAVVTVPATDNGIESDE